MSTPKTHEMKLHEKWFREISCGTKRFEARVNDEKRQAVKVGDIVNWAFDGQTVSTVVTERQKFESFVEVINTYIENGTLQTLLPGKFTFEEAIAVYHGIAGYEEATDVVVFGLQIVEAPQAAQA